MGKAVGLMYFLVGRLLERQPTVLCMEGDCFVFDRGGAHVAVQNDFAPMMVPGRLNERFWILDNRELLLRFKQGRAFIVLAADLEVHAQTKLEMLQGGNIFYLDPWPWHQLCAA